MKLEARTRATLIICVYNGELYLKAAIESALAGAGEDVEVICIDDGSTDSTMSIVKQFSSRVHYYYYPHNGLPSARNVAIGLAKGEYLAFLDADDVFVEGRLTRQLAAFESNPALDIVFGHVKQFVSPELSEDWKIGTQFSTEATPARVPGTMLIKRDSFLRVGPFVETTQVAYFMEWYSRALERGLRVEMVPDVVVLRRIHMTNLGITAESTFVVDHARVIKAMLDRRRQAEKRSQPSGRIERMTST